MLAVLFIVAFVGMLAFAVDYGYLLKVRTDLQRAADAAALAAVQDLTPAANRSQDLDAARATARTYTQKNLEDPSFQVAAEDIEIGRFDPQTIYSHVTLLNTGTFDAVRVTLRRNGSMNPLVPLFFARVIGHDASPCRRRRRRYCRRRRSWSRVPTCFPSPRPWISGRV